MWKLKIDFIGVWKLHAVEMHKYWKKLYQGVNFEV